MSQTNGKAKHAGGAPRKIKDVHELKQKINAYFEKINAQPPLEREPVTITGLVLSCGYADINSFYAMEKRKEFTSTIKAARTLVVNAYERRLHGQNAAGAIFALKNFGWRDDYAGKPPETTQPITILVTVNSEQQKMSFRDLF